MTKIYAIGDLHLCYDQSKPMEVFGAHWARHWDRIREDWKSRVERGDWVLIPGDISWAMTLDEAEADLREIAEMPGNIVLLRGNHDYWWSSISRLRALLPGHMHALQNNAIDAGAAVLCGTRGWLCPSEAGLSVQDRKIYLREVERLRLSLDAAKKISGGREIICMTHYPPFNERREPNEMTALIGQSGIRTAVYGHLHNRREAAVDRIGDTCYHLTACDALGFSLKRIS